MKEVLFIVVAALIGRVVWPAVCSFMRGMQFKFQHVQLNQAFVQNCWGIWGGMLVGTAINFFRVGEQALYGPAVACMVIMVAWAMCMIVHALWQVFAPIGLAVANSTSFCCESAGRCIRGWQS